MNVDTHTARNYKTETKHAPAAITHRYRCIRGKQKETHEQSPKGKDMSEEKNNSSLFRDGYESIKPHLPESLST